MNVVVAREVLRQIQRQRTASVQDSPSDLILRVASRYLIANIKMEYDRFLRLQVLEGAAGPTHLDRWWKKGKMGFAAAADAFSGTQIQPEWLNPNEYSGMYAILERIAEATLHSYGVSLEPFDFLNNALMGIPLDASDLEDDTGSVTPMKQTLRPPFEAGKYLSKKIRDGEESPQTVAKGVLGLFIKRKIQNESRHVLEALPEDDKGKVKDIRDNRGSLYSGIGDFMASLMFGRGPSNPLSDALIKMMRRVWKDGQEEGKGKNKIKKSDKAMILWLDLTLAGKSPSLIELGELVGSTPQVIVKHFWPAGWNAFFKELKTHKRLLKDIADAAHLAGVDWDPNDPIPLYWDSPMEAAGAARGKPRPKVTTTASRVAKRWIRTISN